MARKPRIHYPGAFYHVILRGNAGNSIFFEDMDRSKFFLLLQEGIERFNHRVHAYCLMSNHLHLIVQVGDIPLSRIIQNLSFRYTRYINFRKNQTGHLFQGRYKALLLDADAYLLQLTRYIHNNPVRAKMVTEPSAYGWSSHTVYLGSVSNPWLTTDFILRQFAKTKTTAIRLYNDFQLQALNERRREDYYTGDFEARILGDERFVEEAMRKADQKLERKPALGDILQAVCREYALLPQDLSSCSRQRKIAEARAIAAYLVRECDALSLSALSNELRRDLSGLSQSAGRLEKKMRVDPHLAEVVKSVKSCCT